MNYTLDPKSGNKLSILGFGCMRFPRDAAKTEKLILSAIGKGINYFDTAYFYGNSEETLGDILQKNNKRKDVYLATKLPFHKCRQNSDFDRLFDIQLKRLKTDYIDYYMIHNISDAAHWQRLCGIGIEKWIAGKKSSGQIRQIGFSFHGTQTDFMTLLNAYDWDFCMIQYNYVDENYQAGRAGLLKAHEKGVPVIIMEPLLGGQLVSGLPERAKELFAEADRNKSPAAWALSWLWNQPEVSVVLSGMNSAEQLEDNANIAKNAKPGMLTEKESAVFAPVIAAFKESYKIPCTECNYCMPCPKGVNIPGCFSAYNKSYATSFFSGLTQYCITIGVVSPPKKHASGRNCNKCGACEKSCPQNIKIIKSLEAVTKRMEPFWFKPVTWVIRKVIG